MHNAGRMDDGDVDDMDSMYTVLSIGFILLSRVGIYDDEAIIESVLPIEVLLHGTPDFFMKGAIMGFCLLS